MNSQKISLIYADKNGQLLIDPELTALGLNGRQVEIADGDWLDFPSGAELITLPGRLPLGYNEESGEVEVVDTVKEQQVTALAAILPVGFTRTLNPGYEIGEEKELPLLGYTAVGSCEGHLKLAAIKTDEELKWNPSYYNTPNLPRLISKMKQSFPENCILDQLAKCALEYHCLTAQNIFYERWEAGIPVSPKCNAHCLGCISLQPAECCPSPQQRIKFVPSVKEVSDLATHHLETAGEAIVSFGQGCEGEPTLQEDLLVDSIRQIRALTSKGTINLNSNAGRYHTITNLIDAGLDSIRVSLFSAVPENYDWYHQPQDFGLGDVKKSLRVASKSGLMVALNLLFFPGFTNQVSETGALYELINETGVKQVQIRNLNLDPEKLESRLKDGELPGISFWLKTLQEKFPAMSIGNYSRPVETRER